MRRARIVGTLMLCSAFVADQASKAVIVSNASALWPALPVVPGLNLTFGRNTGVSFGLLADTPWWVLGGLTLVMVLGLIVWLWRSADVLVSGAIGLVIGGALGNALDRVRYGGVTDFIDVYVASYHWPTFNLADVAIVTGAFALAFEGYLRPSPTSGERPHEDGD